MIKIKNINKIFIQEKIKHHVLHDLNLTIQSGEYIAIMGKSGSGKTSLLNILGLMDNATSGKYWLEGKCVNELNDKEKSILRNQCIGFIFQSFNLIPYKTVYENVILPLEYSKCQRKKYRELSFKALQGVGMEEYFNYYPSELSGGQQQRIAIARAIVNQPRLLLADEPTGNLDSKTGEEVMNAIEDLRRLKKTIILITHDQNIASRADKIFYLNDGKLNDQTCDVCE